MCDFSTVRQKVFSKIVFHYLYSNFLPVESSDYYDTSITAGAAGYRDNNCYHTGQDSLKSNHAAIISRVAGRKIVSISVIAEVEQFSRILVNAIIDAATF